MINAMPAVGGAERLILSMSEGAEHRPVPVITWFGTDNSLLRQDERGTLSLISLRPFSLSEFRRARAVLRECDVVHVHLFPSLYTAPLFSRPTVYTEHNTWNRRRDHAWARPLEKLIYRRLSRIVAISDATRDALSEWLELPSSEIDVIPNGIRLDHFRRVPRSRRNSATVTLGMAARFAPEKDHRTLIRAMTHLPSHFILKLAAEGQLKPEAEREVRKLGLESRVQFVGNVTDIREFFSGIDVYVQSANADGFSIVAVEAMASGLPTLGADIPGLRDTIGHSRLTFRHGDPSALAEAVIAVTRDDESYGRATTHAVGQAARFDIRETARKYQQVYDSMAR